MKKAVALRATAFFVKFKKLFNNELCVCVCVNSRCIRASEGCYNTLQRVSFLVCGGLFHRQKY